jgi:hypothetical protein
MSRDLQPYLLYQWARFGALSIPQALHLAEGKCRRSSLYRELKRLVRRDLIYPLLNPATNTRGYYATPEGRREVFGDVEPMIPGVKTPELDHSLEVSQVLIDLCRFENVTGIIGPYELSATGWRAFARDRFPDGAFRLTQDGQHYEIAVEVESTVRSGDRIEKILENYREAFKTPCSGVLFVTSGVTNRNRYMKAIAQMPEDFQKRVRVTQGVGSEHLAAEAYGALRTSSDKIWDLTRTESMDGFTYSPSRVEILLSQQRVKTSDFDEVGQTSLAADVSSDV